MGDEQGNGIRQEQEYMNVCDRCHHQHMTDEDEGVLFVLACLDCDCMEGVW